ncbi:hypothetical protein ABZP36_005315 [Zizania latifolia]
MSCSRVLRSPRRAISFAPLDSIDEAGPSRFAADEDDSRVKLGLGRGVVGPEFLAQPAKAVSRSLRKVDGDEVANDEVIEMRVGLLLIEMLNALDEAILVLVG